LINYHSESLLINHQQHRECKSRKKLLTDAAGDEQQEQKRWSPTGLFNRHQNTKQKKTATAQNIFNFCCLWSLLFRN
jgi:hypothetical protein